MKELESYLDGLLRFGIKLGLEQTRALAAAVGSPENRLRFIHIAGSNGKGSVGAMIASALRNAGIRTGFYTSPHLVDVSERIRIDGRAVAPEVLNAAFGELKTFADKMAVQGACPTYFEFLTVLALKIFADARCEAVVWETGMGGRFDATNIVQPECSIITGIALEHCQYLGSTLEKIAFEKAGIIKPGRPVFLGEMPEEARQVILARARDLASPAAGPETAEFRNLHFERGADGAMRQAFDCGGSSIRLRLAGSMQRKNVRTVLPVLRYLAQVFGFDYAEAVSSLADVRWPARCDELESGEIIDGGHNPDGLRALATSLAELYPGERFTIIFGAFADKDVASGIQALSELAERFIFVPIECDFRPSVPPAELAAPHPGSLACASLEEGWRAAHRHPERILLAGSLHLAGEALARYADRERVLNI